jgi:hypothetical protein
MIKVMQPSDYVQIAAFARAWQDFVRSNLLGRFLT